MKTETSSRPMPKTYRLCVKTDCPRATECLRSIALAMVSPDEQSIQIINPVYLSTIEGGLPRVPFGREGALCPWLREDACRTHRDPSQCPAPDFGARLRSCPLFPSPCRRTPH